jgi:hypothetical protein
MVAESKERALAGGLIRFSLIVAESPIGIELDFPFRTYIHTNSTTSVKNQVANMPIVLDIWHMD